MIYQHPFPCEHPDKMCVCITGQSEITFNLDAATNGHTKITARTLTLAEAQEIAAQFPKSIKVRATTLSGRFYPGSVESPSILHDREAYDAADTTPRGYVHMEITLQADGVNKGVNETGIKRYRSFRKHCERLGYTVTYQAAWGNSYPTEADFEASLAA